MKNFVKKIGIIAFVAVIGLGLFSCEEPEDLFDAGSGEQTVLKITDIDAQYNGKWVIGGLNTTPTAVALGTEIKDGTVSLKILNSDSSKPAYAEGYYNVVLVMYKTQAEANAAKKDTEESNWGAVGIDIKKGEVTIPFSEFMNLD